MNTRVRFVLALSAAAPLLLASCGGGGGGGDETSADEERLAELRGEVEFLFETAEAEALLAEALDIAERNAGTPLGDEAFAFAEGTVTGTDMLVEPAPFSDRAPDVPAELDEYSSISADEWRGLVGFLAMVPPGFEATAVRAELHQDFVEHADYRLTDLRWAQINRAEWAQKLEADGSVAGSWFDLTERLENGMGASMGSKAAEEYAADLVELRYMRELAVAAGEPADFLAAWDQLIAGYELGAFAPPNSDSAYENGTFITYYSEEAVTAGAQNAEALAAVIATCRAYFPETGD